MRMKPRFYFGPGYPDLMLHFDYFIYGAPQCASIGWNLWDFEEGLIHIVLWGNKPYNRCRDVFKISILGFTFSISDFTKYWLEDNDDEEDLS